MMSADTVLVTGGTGFLGSYVARDLVDVVAGLDEVLGDVGAQKAGAAGDQHGV